MGNNRERQANIAHRTGTPRTRRLPESLSSWPGSWPEYISVAWLFLALMIALLSIEQARWITPQPSLILVLGLAVLTGWLLVKSRWPDAAAFPLSLVLGAAVTIWQASQLLPPLTMTSNVNQAIAVLHSWWQTTVLDNPGQGTMHFAMFLVLFTWIMGYTSTWFILRRQNAWVAVTLGMTTILVNLSNLTGEYYRFFLFYLLAAMLLVGQTSMARHYHSFQVHRIKYPRRGLIYFTSAVLCLSVLTATGVWFMPEVRANQLQTLISSRMPWGKDIDKYRMNFFAAIPAKQPFLRSRERETLFFTSPTDRSERIQFVVASARQPSYWRTRRYDIYHSWGWTSSPTTEHILSSGTPTSALLNHSQLTYTVVNRLKTDILLVAGELISSDIPASLRTLTSAGEAGDIITATSPRFLNPSESYTITTGTTSVPSTELSTAGDDYPQWVTDYYLQLPDSLPGRVRQLSQRLTERAKTPYDKVVTIKRFLYEFRYDEENTTPPQGVDGVDYFLFTQQSGDCTNFASAAVVMLRSAGVPSRFTTGYLPGKWNKTRGTFSIRARDYHAWPEVYLPGYGWIEFEVTPLATDENDGFITAEDWLVDELAEEDLVGTGSGTVSTQWSWIIPSLVIVGIGSLLLIPGLVFYRRLRRFSEAGYASEVYAKMCSLASLVKLRPRPQQTPLEYCLNLVAAFPPQAEAIGTITQAYLESRFSPRRELGVQQQARLHQSWRVVSRALLRRLFRLG